MSEVSFPGDGQDGEQPLPAVPARDEAAGAPRDGHGAGSSPARDQGAGVRGDGDPEDDWDPDAEMTAFFADLDAGRARIPEEWELEGPAVTISLGDAADVDPAELAAMVGPEGLGGEVFSQDRPAGVMRPGPVLCALTEGAIGDQARLTDNQLLGAVSAARRLAARAEYLELAAIGEFTRRREAQAAADTAAQVRPGRREGEFAADELGFELVTSANAARDRMDLAADLATRLPATRAALAAGMIDGYRAVIIWRHTRFLTVADAAHADDILSAAAPRLRYDQLAKRALALAMKLDPEGVKRGKDQDRADRQRVEARPEPSGNASLSGRELAIGDVLASKAHIDALAAALRRGGMQGSLRQLRVLVYLDLTQGRDPLQRLIPDHDPDHCPDDEGDECNTGHIPADPEGTGGYDAHPGDDDYGGDATSHDGDGDGDYWDRHPSAEDDPDAGDSPADTLAGSAGDDEDEDDQDGEDGGDERRGGGPSGGPAGPGAPPGGRPAPFPALINLIVPAGTLVGSSTAPGEAGGWGLTDHDDTRRLVAAASKDPRTRWCVTLTGPDGTATAHGCARGPHGWTPNNTARDGPRGNPGNTHTRDGAGRDPGTAREGPAPPGTTGPEPSPGQAAALAQFLRALNITLTPIARGTCDHASAEDRYTPSRKLKHVTRARTATCPAPGCGAQAFHADIDHTLAYPAGRTDQCNLGPPCRHHHHVKQAPGWKLEQPEPGVMLWTTPAGRTYTTTPTVYDV